MARNQSHTEEAARSQHGEEVIQWLPGVGVQSVCLFYAVNVSREP